MSPYADAVRTLTSWPPPSDAQDALRRTYLEQLRDHRDGLSRSCHPDHLTASALIVSADRTHVLLTLHRRLGRWLQTGGHVEATDGTLHDAALREAREESGIDDLAIDPGPVLLSRHELACGPAAHAHHLDVQYVVLAPAGASEVVSEESYALGWFGVDDLPEVDDSVRALVAAARVRLSPRAGV